MDEEERNRIQGVGGKAGLVKFPNPVKGILTDILGDIGLVFSAAGIVLAVGLLIWGLSAAIRLISGGDVNGEREGKSKLADCREIVWHKERPISDVFKIYTCEFKRNSEARIIGGTCVRIEHTGDGSACQVYTRTSDVPCPEGSLPAEHGTGCTPATALRAPASLEVSVIDSNRNFCWTLSFFPAPARVPNMHPNSGAIYFGTHSLGDLQSFADSLIESGLAPLPHVQISAVASGAADAVPAFRIRSAA